VVSQGERFNVYSPVDVPAGELPARPRVFVSHRNLDKPLAKAVTAALAQLGVHYNCDTSRCRRRTPDWVPLNLTPVRMGHVRVR
jgi:hypothetical protein